MNDTVRTRLRCVAEEYLADSGGSHRLDHTVRVVTNARRLMASYDAIDHDVLEAAAWLHDIGRASERAEGISHAIISARLAEGILPAMGFSLAQTSLALEAIADHRFSTGRLPASLEGKILQDADRLDALGAIGIARTFAEGYQRELYHPADPFAQQRVPDDLHYTLDHFYIKLLKLPATLHTPEAKALAAQRLQFMHDFLHELAHELSADDMLVVKDCCV